MWPEQALEQQHSKPSKRRRSRAVVADEDVDEVNEHSGAVEEEPDVYGEDEDEESDFEL